MARLPILTPTTSQHAVPQRQHGGTDARGPARCDFSTNSNACGPCPTVLQAVQQADASRYPDATYTALRHALAGFHGVEPGRIVLAASASEAIQRMTAACVRLAVPGQGGSVSVPCPAYGDYAHAAHAWGWPVIHRPHGQPFVATASTLHWYCDPASPTGQDMPSPTAQPWPRGVWVLDRAYQPLRLHGTCGWPVEVLNQVWQLWSPNKALGLTGVRAAYLIAPVNADDTLLRTLEALAPSWPIGAHGVAMLHAWTQPDTDTWLAASRDTLRHWHTEQLEQLTQRGWTFLPSQTPFACGQPPHPLDLEWLHQRFGVRLRDTTSMGLPGHCRLSAQPPAAQAALLHALDHHTHS